MSDTSFINNDKGSPDCQTSWKKGGGGGRIFNIGMKSKQNW